MKKRTLIISTLILLISSYPCFSRCAPDQVTVELSTLPVFWEIMEYVNFTTSDGQIFSFVGKNDVLVRTICVPPGTTMEVEIVEEVYPDYDMDTMEGIGSPSDRIWKKGEITAPLDTDMGFGITLNSKVRNGTWYGTYLFDLPQRKKCIIC